jgi:hypothetical protein
METFALYLARGFAGLRWILLLFLTIVVFLTTPFMVLMVVPFLQKSLENVLPKNLQFLNTYDDLGMNQGMYEPQVKWVYDYFGWYVKTWYWLGLRNQCYTLFNWLAPEINPRPSVRETKNWKIQTVDSGQFLILHKTKDVGFGWKLFNIPGKCSFYFRPRFWKAQNN